MIVFEDVDKSFAWPIALAVKEKDGNSAALFECFPRDFVFFI